MEQVKLKRIFESFEEKVNNDLSANPFEIEGIVDEIKDEVYSFFDVSIYKDEDRVWITEGCLGIELAFEYTREKELVPTYYRIKGLNGTLWPIEEDAYIESLAGYYEAILIDKGY